MRCAKRLGKTEYTKKYKGVMNSLREALNNNAWDGKWFKRAFTDDGDWLGSNVNDECRIDSIAQSWAVISGAGDLDKVNASMQSLDEHLIDREIRYY